MLLIKPLRLLPLAALLALAACKDKTSPTFYTITFNTNGGTDIHPLRVEGGKSATPPADKPKKDKEAASLFDLGFENWYADADFKTPFDFTQPITANIMLYARYAYLISTQEQLAAVANDLNGLYRLQNNITLTLPEWIPIGDKEKPFTGRLDGQGHLIGNLNIEHSSKGYSGLFGVVGKNGMLQAVGVAVRFISGGGAAGALAAYNYGYVSGYAVREPSAPSYFTPVNGDYRSTIGGLVGVNDGGTVIGYAAVELKGNGTVGGLVGLNTGKVIGYCAVGPLSAGLITGGLVGFNNDSGTIEGYTRSNIKNGYPYIGAPSLLTFGLLVGLNNNTAADAIKGYRSGKDDESQTSGFSLEVQSTGVDGSAIDYTATTKPTTSDFKDLTFGDKPGEWTWVDGRWPSINLEAPVDQSAVTAP